MVVFFNEWMVSYMCTVAEESFIRIIYCFVPMKNYHCHQPIFGTKSLEINSSSEASSTQFSQRYSSVSLAISRLYWVTAQCHAQTAEHVVFAKSPFRCWNPVFRQNAILERWKKTRRLQEMETHASHPSEFILLLRRYLLNSFFLCLKSHW